MADKYLPIRLSELTPINPADQVLLLYHDNGDGTYSPTVSMAGSTSTIGSVTLSVVAVTPTLSNVSASASSVTVLAANANRKDAIIHNDSTVKVRVTFGATASTTSFVVPLGANETLVLSTILGSYMYQGIISGIWESATGSARVTELT